MIDLELVGYAGSALVALSLTMDNIWRLRWINTAGAAIFVLYGWLLAAYPILVLNAFIAGINLVHLYRMSRRKDFFGVLEVAAERSAFRSEFLERHREDIARHFPEFDWDRLEAPRSIFVLRNLRPVGLLVYRRLAGGVAAIDLDYVIPEYRDLKNAHYLYARRETFVDEGVETLEARTRVPSHQAYLRRMGFLPDPADPAVFRRPA